MKHLTCAALAALFLAGCGGGSDLVGTWVLDVDALQESAEFKKMPADEQQQALALLKQSSMTVTFTEDTIEFEMSMMGMKQTKSATYEVTKTDGDKIHVKSTEDGKTETVVFRLTDDRLHFEDKNTPFVLKRK